MRHQVLRAVILAVIFGSGVPEAFACSCIAPPSPKQALKKSSAVFSGEVTAIEVEGFVKKVTISVGRSWKGARKKTVTVTTSFSGASCGYGFQKGKKYLVYCYRGLETGLCTRTKTLKSAKEDIKELGEGTKVGK